jgi:hypothetical protein
MNENASQAGQTWQPRRIVEWVNPTRRAKRALMRDLKVSPRQFKKLRKHLKRQGKPT